MSHFLGLFAGNLGYSIAEMKANGLFFVLIEYMFLFFY